MSKQSRASRTNPRSRRGLDCWNVVPAAGRRSTDHDRPGSEQVRHTYYRGIVTVALAERMAKAVVEKRELRLRTGLRNSAVATNSTCAVNTAAQAKCEPRRQRNGLVVEGWVGGSSVELRHETQAYKAVKHEAPPTRAICHGRWLLRCAVSSHALIAHDRAAKQPAVSTQPGTRSSDGLILGPVGLHTSTAAPLAGGCWNC